MMNEMKNNQKQIQYSKKANDKINQNNNGAIS